MKATAERLLDLVPADGTPIGNKTLRDRFTKKTDATEDDYWKLRHELLERGEIAKGRGRGGSVYRSGAVKPPKSRKRERDDYGPFAEGLRKSEILRDFVLDQLITKKIGDKRPKAKTRAAKGNASRGKWAQPDVFVAAVQSYKFLPKTLRILTVELKPSALEPSAIEGIFEALAHSAFAHFSYLAVRIDDNQERSLPDRVLKECQRLGVGCITYTDPSDGDTFEVVVSARPQHPEPSDVDQFLKQQLTMEEQDKLLSWIKN